MKTLGQRLKSLRGTDSQAVAAKRSGISQQQWSKLERDLIDVDDTAVLSKIADAYGISTDELRGARPTRSGPPAIVQVGSANAATPFLYVAKVTGARLSAGSGELVFDLNEVERSHAFQEDWMREKGLDPDRCRVWGVKGDSMDPKYAHGSWVLINMAQREPVHGRNFALVGEDGLKLKQLRRSESGGWIMYSLNPDQSKYPPEPIVDENYAVIGRVRGHGGDDD